MEVERAAGAAELVFIRGEVTLRADLPALIGHARALGYRVIQLQTDGRRLSYRRYARALARSGLTHVEVSLYAGDAATHDALARVPGAFAQAWSGLSHAVAEGLAVQAQVPLARPALASLAALPSALADAGVGRLQLSMPRPILGPDGSCSPHVPTLTEALLTLREVSDAADERLTVECEGLPLCVLGSAGSCASDYAPTRAQVVIMDLHRTVRSLSELRPTYRPWAPACDTCAARAHCPTTWGAWLSVHGDHELRPLRGPP